MTFALITHVEHTVSEGKIFAYGPYVREMNIWSKHVDKIILVAPRTQSTPGPIDISYDHENIKHLVIPCISLTSFGQVLKALIVSPFIVLQIFRAMWASNHIHLRCPGNIGLLGCWVQVLFPKKPKTAKYAGNWDPQSDQPRSYRIQKKLLSNTFWTRRMNALVYGDWPDQTRNIKPFFTATYYDHQATVVNRSFSGPVHQFLFVGGLTEGKRPGYAFQLVEALLQKGIECRLDFFGDGIMRPELERLIDNSAYGDQFKLHGNKDSEAVKKAYQSSDFLILPSRSEGWPKAVAEAMFWGCIPISSKVSCVPWMLDHGKRGVLLSMNLEEDVTQLRELIDDQSERSEIAKKGQSWSREFTLNRFEEEIIKLLE